MLAAGEEDLLVDAHAGVVIGQHGDRVGLRILGAGGLGALQDLILQVVQRLLGLLVYLRLLLRRQRDAQVLGHLDIDLVVDQAVEDVVLQALHARLGSGIIILPVAIVHGVHVVGVDVAIVVVQ